MSYVSSSPGAQPTLASCCLVCRQWYSVAIEYLYRTPRITPRNFKAFARAICPEYRERSRRNDLGRLVHRFSMEGLVHESSISLTTRLLGRMKENLELYRAPMASFSETSLVPLSKSKSLRVLDLALVSHPLDLTKLKNAIKALGRLTHLLLPKSVVVPYNLTEVNAIPWPPNLRKFQFSNIWVSPNVLLFPEVPKGKLSWPETMTSLTIRSAPRFPYWAISDIFADDTLARTLRRVRMKSTTVESSIEEIFSTPGPVLCNLTFLSVPGFNLTPDFFAPLFCADEHSEPEVWKLEILEFGLCSATFDDFPLEAFTRALAGGLRNLRRLGFHEAHASTLPDELDVKLDRLLEGNALKAGFDLESVKSGDIPTGVYYFNEDY
ncbi:hypothetical protein VTO42DRAFT_1003 [Malbranchea cinnamomea]